MKVLSMLQSGEPRHSNPLAFAEGLFYFKIFHRKRRIFKNIIVLEK
jgi:hypothetical protein